MEQIEINNEPNFIDENIDDWSDPECLLNMCKFLGRVRMSVDLTQDEEGGPFTGKMITLICGDVCVESDTLPLDYPLMIASAETGITVH